MTELATLNNTISYQQQFRWVSEHNFESCLLSAIVITGYNILQFSRLNKMESSQDTASMKIMESLRAIDKLIATPEIGIDEINEIKLLLIENAESAYESSSSDEIEVAINLLEILEGFDEVQLLTNQETRVHINIFRSYSPIYHLLQ